jgi:hypothetical protein
MKIKFFKKENNFKKKNFVFNTNLYWGIALFGAFAIILYSFFFGYNLFKEINQEPVLPDTNQAGQVPVVKIDRLKTVLNYFSLREQKSIQILNSPAPVVDPSL